MEEKIYHLLQEEEETKIRQENTIYKAKWKYKAENALSPTEKLLAGYYDFHH